MSGSGTPFSGTNIWPMGFNGVATGLSAAGSTRTDATVLTKQVNNVATVSASTTGVVLPALVMGVPITVFNASATAMHVYSAGSDQIDGVVGTTGVVLSGGKGAIFWPVAANNYYSWSGAKSA